MSERQQVWKLMMFELKSIKALNILNFILFTTVTFVFFSMFIFSGEFDFINGNRPLALAIDFIFLGYSASIVMYTRSKAFKMQTLKGGLYAAPLMVVLRTMPFSEKAILKSRIYLYLLISILVSTGHMLIIYFSTPVLSEWISLEQFPLWLIIWNMVTISIGVLMPMSEPGATYTVKYIVVFCFIFYAFFLALLIALVRFSGNGIFGWLIYFSSEHLIPTLIVSIVLGVGSTIVTYYYMNHFMKKVDYHV
ncbi:hypothetical protein [Alkalicoccobacillus gibsonii]|uniref:hypothetical protein n=1 Tax=Alkalicoccobacillus gibsonii TaxID=79881 RepID=UPI0019329578|nr:hypothetical protein [Alkalicoccobacillus gibsonii]MBM0065788.1 hypothetical protein [Alkalicoccobacillus gibsonii]